MRYKLSRNDNIKAVDALKNLGIQFVAVEENATNELKHVMESANQEIVRNSGLTEALVQKLNAYLSELSLEPLADDRLMLNNYAGTSVKK